MLPIAITRTVPTREQPRRDRAAVSDRYRAGEDSRAGCQQAAYDRGQPAQAWKAIQLANSGAPAKTGSHPLQRKYPHQTMLMPGNALSAAK